MACPDTRLTAQISEFWNKAMPSAVKMIHCSKNSFSVLQLGVEASDQPERDSCDNLCEPGESPSSTRHTSQMNDWYLVLCPQ